MSDPLSSLDLKFLPDWLKETTAPKKYADHPGESSRESRGAGDSRGFSRGGPRRDGGGRSDGPRREGPGGRRDERLGGGPRRGGQKQDFRGASDRPAHQRSAPKPEAVVVPVRVQILPEPNAAANIAKQIRVSAKAYPLFGTARMFLEKPERHALRISSSDSAHPLHQLEGGPIAFDASLLDRNAFHSLWEEYYKEEVTEVEPPKGNYTSVALCRATGTLLGPTSHHAYQVGMRRLYEENFSRRMSFEEFQRSEVEVVTSPEAVADWKAEVSKQTAYHTLKEAEPIQFKTLQEAEVHFRKHYLPTLTKTAVTLECSGKTGRNLPERALLSAAREAFDKELAYPGALVHGLRAFFDEQGLQVFKHRKRVLYVSAIRPKRATNTSGFADGPATLLTVINESPRISKRDLAIKILGATNPDEAETPEFTARKTQLASDLHYLIHAGHVIEFADGKLDLPLAPQAPNSKDDAQGPDEMESETIESVTPEQHEITHHDEPAPVLVEGETVAEAINPAPEAVGLVSEEHSEPEPSSVHEEPVTASAEVESTAEEKNEEPADGGTPSHLS